MPQKMPVQNVALLRCLEAIRPEALSINEWLKRANVSSSFWTNMRNGREPGIYKIERLVIAAGSSLSAFWEMVETERGD